MLLRLAVRKSHRFYEHFAHGLIFYREHGRSNRISGGFRRHDFFTCATDVCEKRYWFLKFSCDLKLVSPLSRKLDRRLFRADIRVFVHGCVICSCRVHFRTKRFYDDGFVGFLFLNFFKIAKKTGISTQMAFRSFLSGFCFLSNVLFFKNVKLQSNLRPK